MIRKKENEEREKGKWQTRETDRHILGRFSYLRNSYAGPPVSHRLVGNAQHFGINERVIKTIYSSKSHGNKRSTARKDVNLFGHPLYSLVILYVLLLDLRSREHVHVERRRDDHRVPVSSPILVIHRVGFNEKSEVF